MTPVPQSKTSKSPYRVQVLDRALAALEVLGGHSSECSLAEICRTLKLHKSTAHRLMMVLEQHRLVDKNPDTGRYRLGLKLFEFGSKVIGAIDLRRQARPFSSVCSTTDKSYTLKKSSRNRACEPVATWAAALRPIARRLEKPCWQN